MANTAARTANIGGHELPYSEDLSALRKPLSIEGPSGATLCSLKNSLSIQPLEGADSTPDGAPGPYTRHRYERFLASGAGLLWAESIATTEDGRSSSHALWITRENLDSYKRFIGELKELYPDVPIIAQLTHAGRFAKPHDVPAPIIAMPNPHYDGRQKVDMDHQLVSDDYLDRVSESFVSAASLCREAGFDGVDVKACHGYLFSELLSCHTRPGRYGGSFENRSRMLLQTLSAIRQEEGDGFLLASRICHADTIPYPYGFGMSEDGSLAYDNREVLQLVEELRRVGVRLVNVSVGRVSVNPAHTELAPDQIPTDSNEDLFNRFYAGTRELAHAFPDMHFVGSGYTLLRSEAPYVAAGALANGDASIIGFGRMALAYPGFALAMMKGEIDSSRLCTLCGNCYKLLRAGRPTGCPTRDRETYLDLLKEVLGKS